MNLRQIEVFKAVIEHGTVTSAAAVLNISQPGMSKALVQLEMDSGLRLFDRVKGRLAPTELGMRLYDEIDRIFDGVRQVENAIDALHRQAQGHLLIGVMPALSGAFIQRVVTAFLHAHPNTFCSIEARSSQWIMESLVGRRLDVGFVSSRMPNPNVDFELLMENAVVCIMPIGHKLSASRVVRAGDLAGLPYVAFDPHTEIGQRIMAALSGHGFVPNTAVITNLARTVTEFVAAGTGVSLVHPLMVSDHNRIVVRPFEPDLSFGYLMAKNQDSRNARLVAAFMKSARATASEMLQEARAACSLAEPSRARRRRPEA